MFRSSITKIAEILTNNPGRVAAGASAVGGLVYAEYSRRREEKLQIFLSSIVLTGQLAPKDTTIGERIQIANEIQDVLEHDAAKIKRDRAKECERIAVRHGL